MGSATSRAGQHQHHRRPPADRQSPALVPTQPSRASQEAGALDYPQPHWAMPGSGCLINRFIAVLGYLGAALASFLPPLLICLLSRRSSPFLRAHATQALNAALTTVLYAISATIVGVLLALDSFRLGVQFTVTAVLFCWLLTFGYLIAACVSACQGRCYQLPAPICARLRRPVAVPLTSATKAPAPAPTGANTAGANPAG
jgi:uncharacterized Tic20 family protein